MIRRPSVNSTYVYALNVRLLRSPRFDVRISLPDRTPLLVDGTFADASTLIMVEAFLLEHDLTREPDLVGSEFCELAVTARR